MGILGLLQGLKYVSHQGHIRDYAGQNVAVDASSWLHKSVYSIADYYVETTETTNAVDQRCVAAATKYMVTRCQELLTAGGANIQTVYLVMDGKRCPLKAVTNNDRERRRQENLQEARRYKRAGQREKMYDKYKACIKVREDLTQAVLKAVAQRFASCGRVQLVWSPYEADAQLVKLCMDGLTQAVITEDSDVLVYSVACEVSFPILFKLDRKTGACDVISMDWFLSPNADPDSQQTTTTVDLSKKTSGLEPIMTTYLSRQARDPGLGGRLFVQSCVLAGCDYSPNLLTGVGLVTAFKHMRSSIHRTSQERFHHVLKLLPRKARAHLDIDDYEELLAKSEAVFYYHPVCETDGTVVFLQSPNTNTNTTAFAVDSVDGVDASHRPNLCRFEGGWSFLGNMSSDGVLSQKMPEPGRATLPQPGRAKPNQPASSGGMNFFGAKRPRNEPSSLPKAKRARAVAAKVVAMTNPYGAAKKQKEPLLPTSPNEPDRKQNNKSQHNKPNPFAMFARDKENNTSKTKTGGTERFLARDGDNDVRYVKRVFPADGTRTLLQKAASPSTAKAPPPPRSFLVDDKPAARTSKPTEQDDPLDDVIEILEPDDSAIGTRSQMLFDYENDDDYDDDIINHDCQDTLDSTNLSPRRSSDRVSAPFGNPSFHSSQTDDDIGNRSKFFGGKRDYARRVTEELDVDETLKPESSVNAADSPSYAPEPAFSGQQKPAFSFYGDFMSDKSASDQEEIVDSSPETKAPRVAAASSKPVVQRRPNTLMGTTKTLRYRLGGKSATSNTVARKPFSIGQTFRRQGEIAASTRPSATKAPRRGPTIGLKRPPRSAKKQNTLLSHFPLVIQDND
jgi:5'-3' exonuclease